MHTKLSPEGWKTARAAIREGWGPTLRFLAIMTVPTVMVYLVVILVVRSNMTV